MAGKTHPIRMFDAVDVGQIPNDAPAVAGYVNGSFVTFPVLQKKFTHAHLVSITVAGHVPANLRARCIDVEPFDATNTTCLDWLRSHKDGRDYYLWTAHYTGHAHRCTGSKCGFGLRKRADATQWTDHALGRNLDESRVIHHVFKKPYHPIVYTSLSNAQTLVDSLAAHGIHRINN